MKLAVSLKLKPTAKQAKLLNGTLSLANQAANEVSRIAWENKVFGQYD
jgi:hypothetical protein